jgi:ketosteroid isomerase-like protein
MRTTILAALSVTALALVACGGEPPPPPAPPPPPPPPADTASAAPAPTDTAPPAPPPKPALSDLIPAALKGMGDAFNAHDAQKMTSYVTDDCADYGYGAMESHSRGDMATGMTGLFAAMPDGKGNALRVWIKGNVAVQEIVWAGTMKGDMGPIKATNKPIGGTIMQVIWFTDDGLVKEIHEYSDDASMMDQIQGKGTAPPVPTIPSNPPEMHVAKGTPDEDTLAAWGKGIDDTFNKDDAKAIAALWADDGDLWVLGGGPAIKGKKDLPKALTGWVKAIPDQKWSVTNAWGIDGFAIVEHTVSGTHKGAMGKIGATNKPVTSWHWLDVYQPTADNKIQHDWAYANNFEFMKQVGALKMPGGDKGAGAAAPPKKK